MFCKNCGSEIDDNAYVCPNCGAKVKEDEAEIKSSNDNGSKVGWGILSFLIPLVGLILFCVWRTERPKTAKVCGIAALVGFILNFVFAFLIGFLGALAA